jgi:hypothetical protein
VELGIAVVVRFHANEDFRQLDVSVGSSLRPYREGKEKCRWLGENSGLGKRLFEYASAIRGQLHMGLKAANLRPIGSPNAEDWWKCAFKKTFSGGDTVSDIMSVATKLATIVEGIMGAARPS